MSSKANGYEVEVAPDTSVVEQFFVDAVSPAFREDPYPHYEAYRTAEPLRRVDETMWLCLNHGEVTALLRHPKLSSDETRATSEAGRPAPGRLKAQSLLFMDPPDHTRLRRLVARAFTPTRVDDVRLRAETTVTALLDDMADAGATAPLDLVHGLAYPLPVRIICHMLGIPETDEAVFSHWSQALTRSLDPSVLRSAAVNTAIAEAEAGLTVYLDDLLNVRRRTAGQDLVSALLAVESDGDRISATELIDLVLILLVAGHETTVNLIGNGVLALLRNRDQWERLCRSPSEVAGAIDELLRFDSPVQMTQRIATEDLDLEGYRVRRGDEIVLVLGAANRDPAVFTEPDRLDVSRIDARRHVAFGGGIHHCLGAALARLEGQVALAGLLGRFPHLQLAGEPTRRPTFTLRGLESLPVSLGPSA
jgi:cytochrome P450